MQLSHDIVQLVAPPTSEDMLLALSNRGDVTVMDADLTVRHTEPHSSSGSKLVKSFVFATSKCSFLPAGRPPSQITVILFLAADNGLMVLGYTVGEDIERVCEDELDVSTEVGLALSTTILITELTVPDRISQTLHLANLDSSQCFTPRGPSTHSSYSCPRHHLALSGVHPAST